MSDIVQGSMMAAAWLATYFAIVAVHELGHYLAGLLIGIPRRDMRIQMLRFPQHVALRDGDEWVSPLEIERFIKIAETFMPTTAKAMIFVAGGFVLEGFSLFAWVMLRLPFHRAAISLALAMTLFYLAADLAAFLKTRRACMDFSAMHVISPVWGTLIAVGLVALQVFTFCLR